MRVDPVFQGGGAKSMVFVGALSNFPIDLLTADQAPVLAVMGERTSPACYICGTYPALSAVLEKL